MSEFREIEDVQDQCYHLELKQPLTSKQQILVTDASFQATGCTVVTEDGPNQCLPQHAKHVLQELVPKHLLPHKKVYVRLKFHSSLFGIQRCPSYFSRALETVVNSTYS